MTFPALGASFPASFVRIVARFKSDVHNIDALLMASNVVICGPRWAPGAFGGYLCPLVALDSPLVVLGGHT